MRTRLRSISRFAIEPSIEVDHGVDAEHGPRRPNRGGDSARLAQSVLRDDFLGRPGFPLVDVGGAHFECDAELLEDRAALR